MQEPESLYIALVTETYIPEINGVAITLGRLVDGLIQHGHKVQLIHPHNGLPASERQLSVEHIRVPGMRLPFYKEVHIGIPVFGRLRKVWEKNPPQLVHIATEGPLGMGALRLARSMNIPVTSSMHTNFHHYTRYYRAAWLKQPVMNYLRYFHNKTEITFVPTRAMQESLQAKGYQRVGVLSRGIDRRMLNPHHRDPVLRKSWGVGKEDLVVGYVGRLAPEKNLALFEKAAIAMLEKNPRIKFVFVGDGPERQRLEEAHPDFIFVGMKTGSNLSQHYASADLLLFPSTTETYGNVIPEAMASGLAVLSYDYAAGRELIHHDENGLLATVDDEDAFCTQAVRLATDAALVKRLGQEAVKSCQRYDWHEISTAFSQQLITVYSDFATTRQVSS